MVFVVGWGDGSSAPSPLELSLDVSRVPFGTKATHDPTAVGKTTVDEVEVPRGKTSRNKRRVQKMKNLLLPTDALAVMAAGFNAIAFLGKDEKGRIANYHWYTDTIENVDMNLLQYAEEFFKEYLIRVVETISRST